MPRRGPELPVGLAGGSDQPSLDRSGKAKTPHPLGLLCLLLQMKAFVPFMAKKYDFDYE